MKSKKVIVIIAATVIVIIVGLIIHQNITSKASVGTKGQTETPSYATVLPSGKSISQLGGWQRISPPKSDPVYAYGDTIGGVIITVSEQPLPTSFKTNTDDQIASLAKGYNATDKINAGGTSVYIGTSAQGPQSVILTKKGLLILIKSEKKIPDSSWSAYVTTLS